MGQVADLVTRLLLDGSKFDNNIAKSTKQIKNMQRQAEQSEKAFKEKFSAMVGAVGKVAGVLGVAIGATEAFSKAINSTQTTGDAFRRMQNEMKASVDSFFVALATGNFSNFMDNLDDVIEKAGRLDIILDNLGTKTLFNNAEYDNLSTQYQLEINAAKARNKSDEERNKHLEKAKSILKEMISLRSSLASANKEAFYATLDADVAKQGFSGNVQKSTWDYLMNDSNRSKVEASAANYKSWQQRIDDSQIQNVNTGRIQGTKEYNRLKKEFEAYSNTAQGRYEHLAAIFLEMADDEESAIASALKMRAAANSIAVDISSKQLEIENTDARINGSFNKLNKGNNTNNNVNTGTTNEAEFGSLRYYKDEIRKLQTELENVADIAIAKEIQAKINTLEELKKEIEFKLNHSIAPVVENSKTSLKQKADPGKGLQVKGLVTYTKKDIKNNNDFADSLTAISQIMGNIQGATDDATAAWVNYAGNLISSTAGMISAINAISAANEVEQQTASGAAVAEGVKSAAQTPVIGWLLVAAAAASVISAVMSIPKFASGGIVTGASTIGDLNLARVNSGEMILNGTQQSRLFSLLDGGSPASNGVGGGKVEFKIRGQELIGVLDNHNRKTNKLR